MVARQQALGLLETTGFSPAMVALDAMEKTAGITVLQAEINDFLGIILKLEGSVAAVRAALDAGFDWAERLNGKPVRHLIARPDERAWSVILSRPEHNPLMQQDVVFVPLSASSQQTEGEIAMSDPGSLALGFIETQGFTAVFEAIDSACKAADVEVVGKEKLGGGYVTVIIRGDVAAVKAAIDAGQQRVDGLGKLIAAHVIARPSPSVLGLLPKA